MNPKLLTMLNPKGCRLDGTGGTPTFTVDDLNYIMSGANPTGLEIIRRKWSGTKSKHDFKPFINDIIKLSKKWRIRGDRNEKILGLFKLAIYEATELPRCKRCKGKGDKLINGKIIPCSPCRGTGFYRVRDSDKAAMIGVKPPAWSLWDSRYNDVKMILDNHVHDAWAHMNERMSDD